MQCNYQCPYCYCFWHDSPKTVTSELDTAEWKEVIDLCIRKGVKYFLFSGGEALLRKDICDLLDHATLDSNIEVSLFTNGSLMNEVMFFFCKERNIGISTSLQGLRTHEVMTGTKSGYRKTLELISLGHQENWPIAVSIVVTKINLDEIRDVFSAAALCGARFIQLGPMMPEGRAGNHPEWLLLREEWESLKEEIRNMKDFSVPYAFCDEIICSCRSHTPETTACFQIPNDRPCEAGKAFGVIGPDGKYRKCIHAMPPE